MKTTYLRTLLVAVLAAAGVTGLLTVALAEPPSPEFISAALHQQESAAGASLDIEYTWGVPESVAPKAGKTCRRFIHYIRTADVRFVEDRAELYTENGAYEPKITTTASYNRKTGECRILSAHSGKDGNYDGLIDKGDAPGVFGKVEYMETTYYWMVVTPLVEGVTHGSVSERCEDIDGHPCWKITVPGKAIGLSANNVIYVWVDPSIGMCPRRIDSVYDDSKTADNARMDFQEYKEVASGVWFPSQMTQTIKTIDGPVVCCMKVKSMSVGRVVPKAETDVVFPAGTRVAYPSIDAVYTAP